MYNSYVGTGVALVTPFKEDRSIDFAALRRLVRFQIENGTDYLVVMGTTGESATLSELERFKILETVIDENNGSLPIVAGFGGNYTDQVCRSMERFDFKGIDAILSVSPYYNKPSQEGLYQHYCQIAQNSPVPIILYNVPGRTATSMEARTTLRLAHDCKNIIGIKEASGNMEQGMKIIQAKPDDFLVISGDDFLTLPFLSIGMCGVISVLGNAFPREMSQYVKAGLRGKWNLAQKEHYQLLELMEMQMEEGNPAGIKAMMKCLGICEDYLRLPMTNIGTELYSRIQLKIASFTQEKNLKKKELQ